MNKTFGFKLIFVLFSFFIFSQTVFAISGIPKESVWMSDKSPEEGDTVSLFTFVFNGQDVNNLYGTMEWYDNDVLIGERDFTVLPLSGQVISIEWKVTEGNHEIKPVIVNSKSGKEKDSAITVLIEDKEASPLMFFVANKIEETTSDLSEDKIFTDLDNLEKKLASSTPPVVAETVNNGIGFLEETRHEVKDEIFEEIAKVEAKEQKIEQASSEGGVADEENSGSEIVSGVEDKENKTVESPATKYVEKPALGIYKFSLKSLYFILSSALLTYALILLFMYLISRFVLRKIRKK